jgi:hypothetical protein
MLTHRKTTDGADAARLTVENFVRRFSSAYRLLAYCAAIPLILTPELLSFLRTKFLQGKVPWIAEADLLLSDLCRPVGFEQYALDPSVRAYLLRDVHTQLGTQQTTDVAREVGSDGLCGGAT